MSDLDTYDVSIIGAGPSGSIAASLLIQQGLSVCLLEREHFPRFCIGESLLPHCMEIIKQANMLDALNNNADTLAFQVKNGAAFHHNGKNCNFDFANKFSDGPSRTYQVKRAEFDKLLADEVQNKGADIRYGHTVTNFETLTDGTLLTVSSDARKYQIKSKFTLDASGFGRVLPRLLNLEKSSELTNRKAIFAHFKDNINDDCFDREKILICVHPTKTDVWYWLIPFSDGTSSIGVVGETKHFENDEVELESEQGLATTLLKYIGEDKKLNDLLRNAEIKMPVRTIGGYSASVTSLYGENFALLGNAGEFLDPVFSSGVTIAMHSASLVAPLVAKQIRGEKVNWEEEFSQPLCTGIETFKHFVTSWYDTSLQQVIFFGEEENNVKQMICSILAGYAWDKNNPYVSNTKRRLKVLSEICQSDKTIKPSQ